MSVVKLYSLCCKCDSDGEVRTPQRGYYFVRPFVCSRRRGWSVITRVVASMGLRPR